MAQEDPDPLRYADEIARFEAERAEGVHAEGAIVCVGSSSMRMWHKRMAEDLSPLTVIPRGFGGSHYSDVNYFFDELVGAYRPRAVLVYEGDNDVTHGKSPERVFADFMEFREKVAALDPEIRVYVIGVKPSTTRWHLKEEILATNRLIEQACEADERLSYIDVSKFLLNEEGAPRPEIFVEDGVHLNTIGYNLWAAAVGLVLVPAESEYELK
ncbi:GDSL-type esterase/lipase family protein [Pelagicoccus sp. SDUM812005]|uniref:GDSL-type esterase/lipase family protein n=1 Tax=Pelagicoccus sp. SDUM812005 TaxID=3041257 RepID=UPI00281135FB|nr:GDSL-type esterase/lipase family protein [Pelagicoccus sp. SDUM812005]